MNKHNRSNLRILLMQIREHQSVAEEELNSFSKYSGIEKSQIDVLNVFKTPLFDRTVLLGYDSLWVGGASDANVLQPERFPFVNSAQKLLGYCVEQSIPVFASCFGFQLAVLAIGGEIIDSNDEFEIGTIPICLTEDAQSDILFSDTPNDFSAVSVHKQKAIDVPSSVKVLAYTSTCIHSFKVKDKPFWAFQFHPEVDKACLVERLTIYKDNYTKGSEQLESVLQSAVDTPESNLLMAKFVDRVLLS